MLTTGGQVQTAFGSISHPQYNPINLNFDVAVIQIPSPLTLTAAIQTVRLPTLGQASSTFVDWQSIVSGWGATAPDGGVSLTLNWVHKRVISNAQCLSIFGGAVVVDHVVCGMGYNSEFQSHCGGDSGGGLLE